MRKVGGELTSVYVKDQDGQVRNFVPVNGAEAEKTTGGPFTDSVEMGGDGQSTVEMMKNRAGEVTIELQADEDDIAFLDAMTGKSGLGLVTYSHISGDVFSHQAKPVGDLKLNKGKASVSVTFQGGKITAAV